MRPAAACLLLLTVGACASSGGYVRTDLVWAEPPEAFYPVGLERAVIVARDCLVDRGFVVFRVDREGPRRVLWARRGPDTLVRVLLRRDAERDRVALRSIAEWHDRDHDRWIRRDSPREVMSEIDVRLRER